MQHLERRLDAVSELKQLVLKLESDILEHRLGEIRDLVNTYAEQIFVEPITVELRTLKKTATQTEKVQVQLEVFYKNMQCDLSLLSGGEQARLNLAFILAFAHVFHSPLLLLDECTSNLDQELTEIVLEHIESMRISKVILIAHQVVEGNFTQTLRL
jgi:ABC-type transport system involved in cytochrome bd biosynthesis fused ATPase/permease subunit